MRKSHIFLAVGSLFVVAVVCLLTLGRNQKKVPSKVANPSGSYSATLAKSKIDRPSLLTATEWQQYHSARQGALAANPSLRDQYKQLLAQMDSLQAKTDEALVQADPNVKPVVAKLQTLRLRNGGAATEQKSVPRPSGPAPTISSTEWQEIRDARAKAAAQHPDLIASSKKLQEQMIAFERTLDAEMVKADPSSALVISKFDSGRPAPVGK